MKSFAFATIALTLAMAPAAHAAWLHTNQVEEACRGSRQVAAEHRERCLHLVSEMERAGYRAPIIGRGLGGLPILDMNQHQAWGDRILQEIPMMRRYCIVPYSGPAC